MDNTEHRALGVATFNACWDLLEKTVRDANDDSDLLTNAFTSRYHWSFVGTAQNTIMSDWMVSRAAAVAGYGDLAVSFATRAVEAVKNSSMPDWLVASCAEGMARAYDAAGNFEQRALWCERATELVDAIAADEDRALIASQLADLLAN